MHRTGMTELEVVLAVARRNSFRAAALELGMSTTAVSSAVAGLEARLKVRLFNRSTRSVALTDAGQRYVERIAPALAEIRSAGEEAGTGSGVPSGTLRINAPIPSMKSRSASMSPSFKKLLSSFTTSAGISLNILREE